jgi:hypothetical protein
MKTILLCCILSRSALVSGSIADFLTTRHGLQMGLQEANPIVRLVGPGKTIAISDVVVEALIHFSGMQKEYPRGAAGLRYAVGAMHFGAALWNQHEMRILQQAESAQVSRSRLAVRELPRARAFPFAAPLPTNTVALPLVCPGQTSLPCYEQ